MAAREDPACAAAEPPRDGESASDGREHPPAELLAALSDPAMYGRDGAVERRETHGSWVFLSGPWAYKVKKPVKLAFLDYSTRALRRAACEEELRVNAELGGEIYFAVCAIVPSAGGFELAEPDAAGAVEYVLQMRRFDEADTLQGHTDAGTVSRSDLRALAARLAAFHADAQVIEEGALSRVRRRWSDNLAELGELPAAARWRLDLAQSFGDAFTQADGAEIEQRECDGCIRDGHGDLRCEHVLLGREVRIVDRIEFDPALRQIDVACDLAFLAMDLESQGHRSEAEMLLEEYRRAGGHLCSPELRSFYAAGWAYVRAKVQAISAEGAAQAQHAQQAQKLHALAERLCWRARGPIAVIVAGPAASGKSTLAAALAQRSGLSVIASDLVRKSLAGIAAGERARPEHYTDEFTRATYQAVGDAAGVRLQRGEGVIVDATCRTAAQRASLLQALEAPTERTLFVVCHVSLETALARAELRMADAARVSDATPQIVAKQHREFQPPAELAGQSVLQIDCEQALQDQLAELSEALDRQLGARGAASSRPT